MTSQQLFDSKKIWIHSGPNQNPFFTNFRVLADDIRREVYFANKDNNEIDTMTDYNGVTTYAYDDWGRMSTETRGGQTRTYAYVMGSKLASVTGWGNTVQYRYAGDGKRNFRMLNSTVTASYKWDAGYNVVNEENSSGTLAKTYVVATKPVTQATTGVPMEALLVNQGPVGTVLAEVAGSNPASGAYKYYTHDNIQSTRGLFEQNKSVAGTLEYTPYGENYTSPAPAGLTHRFTGLDLDATTGQYYAPYRYFAPNLSRWLTRDPLGMVDGTNMFTYVLAPTSAVDLLGLARHPYEPQADGCDNCRLPGESFWRCWDRVTTCCENELYAPCDLLPGEWLRARCRNLLSLIVGPLCLFTGFVNCFLVCQGEWCRPPSVTGV